MSRDFAYRISALVFVAGVALLLIAFCTGCGTHYVHRSYHPDGRLASEEKYRDFKDRNLGRIDLEKVPTAEMPTIPVPPGGSVPEALRRGNRLLAVTPQGTVDVTSVLQTVAANKGYGQVFASGAFLFGQEEETSGQTAVLGEQINKLATRAAVTILGYQWAKTARAEDANDLRATQSGNELKAFEANEDTKRAAIEAKKQVRLKEIDLAE